MAAAHHAAHLGAGRVAVGKAGQAHHDGPQPRPPETKLA